MSCPVLMLDKADPRRSEPLAGERASRRFHPVAAAAVAGDIHEERVDGTSLENAQLSLKRGGEQVRGPQFHAVTAGFVTGGIFVQPDLGRGGPAQVREAVLGKESDANKTDPLALGQDQNADGKVLRV